MHIGIYTGNYYPKVGGGYTFVKDIIDNLILMAPDYENHFTIFTTNGFKTVLIEKIIPNNITIIEIGRQTGIFNRIRSILQKNEIYELVKVFRSRLENNAKKNHVDIVWFAGHENWAIDIPYISTVWDLGHLTNPWFPELSADCIWEQREGVLNRNLRRSSRIITGTEVGKEQLISFYGIPKDRIHILTHPTPSFALTANASNNNYILDKYGLKNRYLFYPAQFWPNKNHINLLIALKLLNESQDELCDVVLVGSDQGNKRFVEGKVNELELSENVHVLGFVSVDELIELYQHAEALIYPSFLGPENLPPLEAFALSCPVLMSDYPGAREQLGNDSAIFFNPNNPSSMMSSIKKLHNNNDLRLQLIKKGKQRARAWTAKDFISGLMEIIDQFGPIRRNWE